ncbi:hypothetical protein FRC20_001009 [Serendipita sp. 405]|nr:hypothetical protein FRC16_001337 [Serendipita sp. 398]KAG8876671.1 hypothetical protein FRC20_001009 [Serendipita sp. 405]
MYTSGYMESQGHFQAPGDPPQNPNNSENHSQTVYQPYQIPTSQFDHFFPPANGGHPNFDRVGAGSMDGTSLGYSNHVHQAPPFPSYNQFSWQDQPGLQPGLLNGDRRQNYDNAVGGYVAGHHVSSFEASLTSVPPLGRTMSDYHSPPIGFLSPNSSDYSTATPPPLPFSESGFTPPNPVAISPVSPYVGHSVGSTIDLTPTRVVCPASDDEGRCSCEAEPDEVLIKNTPYMPHNGPKPRRAVTGKGTKHKGACRREVVAHFPPDRNLRQLALDFLANPGNVNLLKLLVKPNKRCHGCPNASFSSMTKVQDHILGQFKIKNHICKYCGKRSIRKEDHKNHLKTCPQSAQRHNNEIIVNSLEPFPSLQP